MDAHALLRAQGWRGTGNSLHPTSNSIGLSKPLLVGRKDDKYGLGQKKHHTSDLWFLQAFDQSLQNLETSNEGTVIKSTKSGQLDVVRRGVGKWALANGGLYANFVKGDGLAGSFMSPDLDESKEDNNNEKSIIINKMVLDKVQKKAKKFQKHDLKLQAKGVNLKSNSSRSKKNTESKEEHKTRKSAKRVQRHQPYAISSSPSGKETMKGKSKKKRSVEKSNKRSTETLFQKKKRPTIEELEEKYAEKQQI